MRQKLNALLEPVFICSLCVLLLNDLWLKNLFPGFLTGKLSDFAGIIVFALFWSTLLPQYKKWIFVLTAILFAFWKSPASQLIIDAWDSVGILPVSRVCDPGDLVALLVLPLLYSYKPRTAGWVHLSFLKIPVALLTIFAFCATSYNSTISYNKRYPFPFSIHELVLRMNHLGSGCKTIPLSLNFRNADSTIIWGNDTSWVAYGDSIRRFSDTIYKYNSVKKEMTHDIDTIYNYVHRNVDTNYIHGSNAIRINFDAGRLIKDTTMNYCKCFDARILIRGDADTSSLALESITAGGCIYTLKKDYGKKMNEVILSVFEREVVKKIYW